MRKRMCHFLIFNLIVLFLLSSAGCSSSRKESVLKGSPDNTEAVIADVKLSSESFLGTGIQLPGAEVLRSISIYDGYTHKTNIIESKEDIRSILVYLNGITGDTYPIDKSITIVTAYRIEYNYSEGVDSSLYVDSLVFSFQTFYCASRLLSVTTDRGIEIRNKFESYVNEMS